MNIDAFIESGILQDYCLGVLSAQEMKHVEQMCTQYPPIAQQLQQLQTGLENYAASKTSHRKEVLKKQIWNAINKKDSNPS